MIDNYSVIKKRSSLSNTAGILEVIQAISDMVEEGIILDFVIGGGAATSLYEVPYFTEDIDFFCTYKQNSIFVILDPLFEYLKSRGGRWEERKGKKVFVLGVWPVDFTPATTKLVEEAMQNANLFEVSGTHFKMFSPEYLVAVALETNRSKDRYKAEMLLSNAKVDLPLLEEILKKYNLFEKYLDLKERL